jgi:hypothetical protein
VIAVRRAPPVFETTRAQRMGRKVVAELRP